MTSLKLPSATRLPHGRSSSPRRSQTTLRIAWRLCVPPRTIIIAIISSSRRSSSSSSSQEHNHQQQPVVSGKQLVSTRSRQQQRRHGDKGRQQGVGTAV